MASYCCHESASPEGNNDTQCDDSFKTIDAASKVSKIVINGFKSACADCCGNTVTDIQPVIVQKIKPKKTLNLRYRGFFFTIMSSLCFSLTAVVVKMLSDYHTVTVGLWRFQGTFLPAIPFMICHHMHEKKRNKLSGNNESKSKELKIGTTEWWKVLGILVVRWSLFAYGNNCVFYNNLLAFIFLAPKCVHMQCIPFAFLLAQIFGSWRCPGHSLQYTSIRLFLRLHIAGRAHWYGPDSNVIFNVGRSGVHSSTADAHWRPTDGSQYFGELSSMNVPSDFNYK